MTHTTYQVLEMDKISKKKRVALTIENKLENCKMLKNYLLKSFIIQQFSTKSSALYKVLLSVEKLKAEKEELSF